MNFLAGNGASKNRPKRQNHDFAAISKAGAMFRQALGQYYEGMRTVGTPEKIMAILSKAIVREETKKLSLIAAEKELIAFQLNEACHPQQVCHALHKLEVSRRREKITLTIEDIELCTPAGHPATHVRPLLLAFIFPDWIYVSKHHGYSPCIPDFVPSLCTPTETPLWNLAAQRTGQTTIELYMHYPVIPPNTSLVVLRGYQSMQQFGGKMLPLWKHSALQIEGIFREKGKNE